MKYYIKEFTEACTYLIIMVLFSLTFAYAVIY